MSEIKFVDGLKVERNPKAPEWVIASLNFKVDQIIPWLQANAVNGYVKADIKLSKKGSMYAAINDWKPSGVQGQVNRQVSQGFEQPQGFGQSPVDSDDIPF
jgi:hypothetical protein